MILEIFFFVKMFMINFLPCFWSSSFNSLHFNDASSKICLILWVVLIFVFPGMKFSLGFLVFPSNFHSPSSAFLKFSLQYWSCWIIHRVTHLESFSHSFWSFPRLSLKKFFLRLELKHLFLEENDVDPCLPGFYTLKMSI